ncbi:MAG: hypothetical protein KDJ52_16305 [Anaerolineae bacterium]|nr:hypothetical protein [Anaerolineae bacterium]
MKLPDEKNPIWKKLVCGERSYQFQFLGTKLILGRLNLRCKKSQSSQEVDACIRELRNFFEQNLHLPKVQIDLKQIFGPGAI